MIVTRRNGNNMDTEPSLTQAIEAFSSGDKSSAMEILNGIVKRDPQNEQAWFLLSSITDETKETIYCLERALAINPDNHIAQRQLNELRGIRQPPGAHPPSMAPVSRPPSPTPEVTKQASKTHREARQDARSNRLLFPVLAGVLSLTVLCVASLVAYLYFGGADALVAVLMPSPSPAEPAATEIAPPTPGTGGLFEEMPPTWTPSPTFARVATPTSLPTPRPTHTPVPTPTPIPTQTLHPTDTPRPPQTPHATDTPLPPPTPVPAGSPFTIGDWELRVDKVEVVPSLTLPLIDVTETATGQFALVFLSVTNRGSGPDIYTEVGDMLIQDSLGRQYKPRLGLNEWAETLNGIKPTGFTNPNETVQTIAVFDIAENSSPYYLVPGILAEMEGSTDWKIRLDIP